MNNTSQSGIRRTHNKFNNNDLFRNVTRLDAAQINQWDPFVNGYYAFFWLKMPYFMEVINPELTERFKNFTEKGSTSFDGIQDQTLDTDTIMGGIAGNEFQIPTNMKHQFSSFNMKVFEQNGSLVREMLDFWAGGIRDKDTGVSHMQGFFETEQGRNIDYSLSLFTGEALYVVFDPTMRSRGIEYAALLSGIFPTKIPVAHFNGSHGEHNAVSFDIEFAARKYDNSRYINERAARFVELNLEARNHYDFNPEGSFRE